MIRQVDVLMTRTKGNGVRGSGRAPAIIRSSQKKEFRDKLGGSHARRAKTLSTPSCTTPLAAKRQGTN